MVRYLPDGLSSWMLHIVGRETGEWAYHIAYPGKGIGKGKGKGKEKGKGKGTGFTT